MDMDRAGLVESVVQGVEERLVPGAMGAFSDVSALIPDRPEAPDVPGVPNPSGFLPQAPGMPPIPQAPQMPGIPDLPQAPGMPGMPSMPGMPGIPDVPQAPSIPDPAQNGLANRARQAGDAFHNGLHADHRNPASERASRRELAADGFSDQFESEDEPQDERQPFADDEEHATAVLKVCRNDWNVVDTRAVGGHWFSA